MLRCGFQCEKAHNDAFQAYRGQRSEGQSDLDPVKSDYHNIHNEYTLQLASTAAQQDEFKNVTLPQLLKVEYHLSHLDVNIISIDPIRDI